MRLLVDGVDLRPIRPGEHFGYCVAVFSTGQEDYVFTSRRVNDEWLRDLGTCCGDCCSGCQALSGLTRSRGCAGGRLSGAKDPHGDRGTGSR
jgi:hypothetical protein